MKSVVKQEIVLRVEGFSALADQRDERLAKPRGQVWAALLVYLLLRFCAS